MSTKKYVYMFTETDETMKNLCGGKGANLGQMTKLGLPIPQGFTVTTEACTYYYQNGEKLSSDIIEEVKKAMKKLEEITGKEFGNPNNPLLVSVQVKEAFLNGLSDAGHSYEISDLYEMGFNPEFSEQK